MPRKRHGWSHDSAVLDVFGTNVFPELCKIGFLHPSGLRSLPVCLWKVGVLHDSFAHGPEVLAAVAEPEAPHPRKAVEAAERQDLTLMQPLLPEPAFLLSTP